jgi:S1-C subfamily serine protease
MPTYGDPEERPAASRVPTDWPNSRSESETPWAPPASGTPPEAPYSWYGAGPAAAPYGAPAPPYGAPGRATPTERGPVWLVVALLAALIGALVGGGVGAAVARNAKRTTVVRQVISPSAPIAKPADIHVILAKVQPAVVSIHTNIGAGTGMILTSDGEVLTNFHVIANSSTIRVNLFTQATPLSASVLGADQTNDVALLKLSGVQSLPTVELGDSSKLQVGDDVVAIGNALNLPGGPTVTEGIVSATDRNLSVDDPTAPNLPLIQTDAAINPGNSGGPLVNSQGQVVGMNTLVIQQANAQEAAQNLGFSIAVNTIKPLLPDLAKGITHAPAFLGVSVATLTPDIVSRYALTVNKGAIVAEVASGGPAALAGLQPLDVITTFDGKPVNTADDVVTTTQKHRPGDSVHLTYVRGGATHTVTVTLGTKPTNLGP